MVIIKIKSIKHLMCRKESGQLCKMLGIIGQIKKTLNCKLKTILLKVL